MPLSTYLKHAVINWARGTAMPAAPTALYVALLTSAPGADGTGGTEVTGGAYARATVTLGAPTAGATDNPTVAQFPTATAAWGTVTHLKVMDAPTVGNTIAWQALAAGMVISAGYAPSIDLGELDLDLNRLSP